MVYRSAIIMFMVLFTQAGVFAQSPGDTAKLFAQLRQLHAAFRQSPTGFTMKYTYASEKNPSVLLDSLEGSVEIADSCNRYSLADMESISNGRYNIVLFREDKLMYLSLPSTVAASDPLDQLRQIASTAGINMYKVEQQRDYDQVNVAFNAGGPCRDMEMRINRKTGYLETVSYTVKASTVSTYQEMDEAAQEQFGEYAIVKIAFGNYRKIPEDKSRFNEQNFFYKEGNKFVPAPAYKDYQIFKGSPNL